MSEFVFFYFEDLLLILSDFLNRIVEIPNLAQLCHSLVPFLFEDLLLILSDFLNKIANVPNLVQLCQSIHTLDHQK